MGHARSDDESVGLSPAVARRVARTWPGEEDRRRVRQALESYGADKYEQEPERLRLAILKLSDGDVEKVLSITKAAKQDFRDVLLWAEYPEAARAGSLTWRSNLTPEEKDRLAELRRRDRRQYEDWLKKSEE